ncbi:hypothetical protein [Burkholderia ambifaria]|uniref:hypothetical protein n=1 Tax=Burkholderia ambifaria TaxID=152480 RepID=UPI00158DFC67|nr:hypothetical protein [Burkholderia ambifaria]
MKPFDESTPLYFVSKFPHRPAGIVQPGKWGAEYEESYFSGRQAQGDPWLLIIELAVENERLTSHPESPSRFRSTYACASLDAAKSFTASKMWGSAAPLTIWSCKHEHPDKPKHVGTFTLFDNLRRFMSFSDAKKIAKNYWSADHSLDHAEVICESPLVLLNRVADFRPDTGWIVHPQPTVPLDSEAPKQ